MADVILKNINKVYPNGVQAVFDFNLEVEHGEFIVFVGPSGCGKSTTLRMIAGLEEITSGELMIGDKVVNNMAPKDRDIAMVFQNYALYAHMSVYHNMAFSLVLRKFDSDEIHKRVMRAAEILGLLPYLNRKPKALSGGQRQRVALGRAIVRDPKVFLLDEPLSNLDAKLRGTMRKELAELHQRLNATMIYVTHDQIEALTLADRMVVMKDGYVQQIGTPIEIYEKPYNVYVAGFIGTPPMNFFKGKISLDNFIHIGSERIQITHMDIVEKLKAKGYIDKDIILGIRPEHMIVEPFYNDTTKLTGSVSLYELIGASGLVYSKLGDQTYISKTDSRHMFSMGDKILISFDQQHMHFFDAESELRIVL